MKSYTNKLGHCSQSVPSSVSVKVTPPLSASAKAGAGTGTAQGNNAASLRGKMVHGKSGGVTT